MTLRHENWFLREATNLCGKEIFYTLRYFKPYTVIFPPSSYSLSIQWYFTSNISGRLMFLWRTQYLSFRNCVDVSRVTAYFIDIWSSVLQMLFGQTNVKTGLASHSVPLRCGHIHRHDWTYFFHPKSSLLIRKDRWN